MTLLDITLQKLTAANLLDKEFSGAEVFNKLRVKFSNASKKVYTNDKVFYYLTDLLTILFIFY